MFGKRIACLLVCAAVALSAAAPAAAAAEKLTPERLLEVAEDYDVPEEFLETAARRDSISKKQFKAYAEEYGLPGQYVQRFIDDAFVFRQGKEYEYVPVDDSLKKSTFNPKHLRLTAKGPRYEVDGVSKANKGIDVSEFQGEIDWKKVKADGVKFAFIRVGYRGYTTGKVKEDKYFDRNMKNATAAGVKVGVYFYSQAISTREARAEAKFVLDRIKKYDVTYPVVFDIESAPVANARTARLSKQANTKIAKAFCDEVKEAGYHPMIYSYTKFFLEKLDLSKLESYDKWFAQYYKVPFLPYKFQFWQYTGTGRVKGIKGNVDINLGFKTYK